MERRILPASRRDQILALLASEGFVRISDAADALQVSPITIRRDIANLAQEGLLEQVRGGARKITSTPAPSPLDATIAIVVPSLDFYWPSIIEGANQACDELQIKLMLQGSTFAARDDLRELSALAENVNITGLLLAPDLEGEGSESLLEFLQALPIPAVLIERQIRPSGSFRRNFESVITDHHNGANLAVRHLTDLGHRKIALLTDKRIPSRHLIRAGWRNAITDLGLSSSVPDFDTANCSANERATYIREFITKCLDNDVTGILVQSDEAALVVVETLQGLGKSVPEDISVVSYDDELANLARPKLTSISPAKKALGDTAVRTLLRRILTPDAPQMQVLIQPQLIVRDSTAALSVN